MSTVSQQERAAMHQLIGDNPSRTVIVARIILHLAISLLPFAVLGAAIWAVAIWAVLLR